MPLNQDISHGTQPPPSSSKTGHPLPRRTSPANSITLRHHRLARDASLKASQGSGPAVKTTTTTTSPRRNSSGDSNETGQSDPKTWFDLSNQNPTATFDSNVMEVDPPFFQKESDSSNEDKPYYNHHQLAPPKLTAAHSSSADDYRSVIDDLTVEIQKLREELKRYKNTGPDMLRKEKLFEIKCHGLPMKKKRELEATLRDFAASLDGSPNASSSQNKKKSRHANRDNMYSGSGSKHASSSSGSNFRPADSAYASMSTGAKSSGTSLSRPSMGSQAKSSEAVENYLRDIPEGLYPRHMIMTDKERKKLVVRRLEQLFTGKIGGRHVVKKQPVQPSGSSAALAPVVADTQPNVTNNTSVSSIHEPPTLQTSGKEPTREARILPNEQQPGHSGKKSRSADNGSASNSNGDNTESGGNGNSTGSGTNPSPPMTTLPEQRPTRPRDLDPDRAQVPAENMDYIRHLGLVPPELLAEQYNHDVHPDAEGWVYLNLLCNLAQLHMINVTPDFVRSAVTGMSTKFQLSPDGRKIRWRGGTEGTRFSSDSSGYNSQRSPSTDDTEDGSESKRKRQKTGRSTGDEFQSGSSSKNGLKYDPQLCAPSESFHYKPLFAQQESSGGQTSLDETVSSFGPPEESNVGESRWGLSGSGASSRKKRRHDGAIIYYSGAPFCTDLSGDPGDMSPTTQMRATGQTQTDKDTFKVPPSPLRRTDSGSFLNYRPLTDRGVLSTQPSTAMDLDNEDPPCLTDDTDDVSEIDLDFTWSDNAQYMQHYPLEPCGLGGVLPEDHFMVVVSTKRPKQDELSSAQVVGSRTSETTDVVVRRLATMSTSSPILGVSKSLPTMNPLPVEIEYMSGRIKRLTPVPLPPPAIFFPPFSPSESTTDDDDDVSDDFDMSQSLRDLMGQRTMQHQSDGYPDGVDLSSGDEEGDEPDDSPNQNIYAVNRDPKALPNRPRQAARRTSSAAAAAGTARGASKSNSANPALSHDDSSIATAGAAESGYSSSDESS